MHKRLYKLLILGWTVGYGCGPANTERPQQPIDSSVAVVSQPKGPAAISDSAVVAMQPKSSMGMPFDSVKKKYRTLIPILNGLFLTYDNLDYEQYRKLIRLPDMDSFFRLEKIMDSLVRQANKMDSPYWKLDRLPSFGNIMGSPCLINGLFSHAKKVLKWGVIDSAGNTILPFVCDAVRAIDTQKGICSIGLTAHTLNTGLQRFRYKGDYFFFDKKGIKDTIGTSFEITVVGAAIYDRDAPPVQQGPTFYLPKRYHKKGSMARAQIEHF